VKITAIHSLIVWVGSRNQLIVKGETDEVLYGWGEFGLSGGARAVVGAIEHFREVLIGRDPMNAGALWQEGAVVTVVPSAVKALASFQWVSRRVSC
jgi:galactonate dehydratase